jgi:hypothetical protein
MKKHLISLGLILGVLFAVAQQPGFNETITQRFAQLWLLNPQEKVYVHTDKHYYSAGETIWVKAYLVNATTHQPTTKSNYIYVELLDTLHAVKQRIKMLRDGAGAFGSLNLPATLAPGEYTLRAYTYWMQNAGREFFFHKKIKLGNLIDTRVAATGGSAAGTSDVVPKSVTTQDFDIQFFPESGHFLTGHPQIIAFKAIGTNGLSTTVSGTIYNQANEQVTQFNSEHRGMGKLSLTAQPGDQFYATVSNSTGFEKRVDLPTPQHQGIGLQLKNNNSRIYFNIQNSSHLPIDSLRLMIHARGEVLLIAGLSKYDGQLPDGFLPEGIVSFSIIDTSERVWCERLLFIRNFIEPQISMSTDKQEYLSRQPIELSFQIQKNDSTPLTGSFSVSVTDSYHVKFDSINDNIRSYLLLSSELKGYIEAPQEYLRDDSPQTRQITDLLMLTQGWKRFNTAELAKGNLPENTFYMEAGQAISGRVFNLFKRPVKGNMVMMLSSYMNQVRIAETDSEGQFYFDGIEFPDSTRILIKAMARTKMVDVELVADTEQFPAPSRHLPPFVFWEKPISDDYLQLSREKYYIEGGMTVIDLDEVTIDAQRKSASTEYYYSSAADTRWNAQRLEEWHGMRVLDILAMMPGVEVNGQEISIRGSQGNPLFVINGVETRQVEDIAYLNVTDIEEIMLFRDASASIFGMNGGNGVIAFTLKEGYLTNNKQSSSMVQVTPLGFQRLIDFYVPRYDVDSILRNTHRDLRTTIFWEPELQPDSTGRVNVRFFAADNPNNYTVELEGMGHNGIICRYKGIIRRK